MKLDEWLAAGKPLNSVICCDVLLGLKELSDESIDCCITSPPYWGLRDYGTAKWEGGGVECEHIICGDDTGIGDKQATNTGSIRIAKDICPKCGAKRIDSQLGLEKTPEEYVAKMVEIFKEVKRVLKKEGTLWLNLGDSYFAKPKSNYGGKAPGLQSKNYGTGDTELGYKKQAEKFKELLSVGYKNKDLVGIPWRVAFALQADGWWLRQDIIWHKPNPMPESVTDRCTKAHEYVFLLAKSAKYYYDNEAITEPYKMNRWGGRYKTNEDVKVSPNEKKAGGQGALNRMNYDCYPNSGRNKRSVWTITTKPFKGAHFATFPEALIEPMVKAGCPEKGIVLDPFCGSGITNLVAYKNNRHSLGFDLSEKYISEIAEKRISEAKAQTKLSDRLI